MSTQWIPQHLRAPVLEAELDALFEEWSWLVPEGMCPQLLTAFGDWILRGDDGTLSMLDTIEGEVRTIDAGTATLAERLQDPNVRDHLFLEGLVLTVLDENPLPGGHCLSFKVPPILGGTTDPSNVEVRRAASVQAWLGRLHKALRDVPPGAQVTGVFIAEWGGVQLEWISNCG